MTSIFFSKYTFSPRNLQRKELVCAGIVNLESLISKSNVCNLKFEDKSLISVGYNYYRISESN